jgi:RNA polymerase sigma-70 factor (ECF subfamily)
MLRQETLPIGVTAFDQPSAPSADRDAMDVARAARGDVQAFERLYRTHIPRVHGIVRRMAGGRDVDELAQDVFVRAWQKLGTFRGESAFTTWLHRLTVNACRDVAQRRLARRCEPLEEDAREARDGDPARAAEASELRAELGACLAEIPPRQAAVVVLKDAFDFSFEEIAGDQGMPVGTAKCYAHRARAGLRERLSA